MSVMSSRSSDRPTGALRGRAGEHITVIVLLLITGFLGYLNFVVIPGQSPPEDLPFEFENPLLAAKPGDCVAGQGSLEPGREKCFIVIERVERPARGPEHLPGYDELRRMPPYVVLELHDLGDRAEGCGGTLEEIVLRGLNQFGLDPISQVAVDSIRPVWMSYGGKQDILYEVFLERFDVPSQYIMYISPDMPVMGLVKQERLTENGPAERAYFREIPCTR
jgi:hypothetical protein